MKQTRMRHRFTLCQQVMLKVRVISKLTIFILLVHIAIFVNPQKKLFAFIIFNPNLKMLLPSKMMGLLWWHQFDGLDISVTSWTTTLQLSVHFLMKRLLYYIQSIWSRKNKPCPLISLFNILFLSEVRHNTGSKNGRKLPVHADFKAFPQFLV